MEQAKVLEFLADDARVTAFLDELLLRYQSSDAVYQHPARTGAIGN